MCLQSSAERQKQADPWASLAGLPKQFCQPQKQDEEWHPRLSSVLQMHFHVQHTHEMLKTITILEAPNWKTKRERKLVVNSTPPVINKIPLLAKAPNKLNASKRAGNICYFLLLNFKRYAVRANRTSVTQQRNKTEASWAWWCPESGQTHTVKLATGLSRSALCKLCNKYLQASGSSSMNSDFSMRRLKAHVSSKF